MSDMETAPTEPSPAPVTERSAEERARCALADVILAAETMVRSYADLDDEDSVKLNLAADVLNALGGAVEGWAGDGPETGRIPAESLRIIFGSVGNWGYHSTIGRALRDVYAATHAPSEEVAS